MKTRQTLIDCANFDWSRISPAIFGAMFQGVMDKDRRRWRVFTKKSAGCIFSTPPAAAAIS
jgi:hypothetical protein